jgi:hypothetical protein
MGTWTSDRCTHCCCRAPHAVWDKQCGANQELVHETPLLSFWAQGGTTISNSAGSLAVMMPPQGSMSLASSPSPRLKVQQPMATSDTRPSSAKQKRVEAAPARAATPPSMPAATPQATYSSASPRAAYSSVNPQASYSSSAPQATFSNASLRAAYSGVSPQAPYSSAAPQSCSNYSMPEPPAPRSWTPSQLGSSGGKHFCSLSSPTTCCLCLINALAQFIVRRSLSARSEITHPLSTSWHLS